MRTIFENILEIISLQISDPTGTQTIQQRAELLKRTTQRLAELDLEAAPPGPAPGADQELQEPLKAGSTPQEAAKAGSMSQDGLTPQKAPIKDSSSSGKRPRADQELQEPLKAGSTPQEAAKAGSMSQDGLTPQDSQ